jgi:hypothetical protein
MSIPKALGATQFTELLAATRDKIGTQGAVDNVTTPHPLLDALKAKFTNATGESLRLTLQLAEEAGAEFTDASGSFSIATNAPILGAAKFDWANPMVNKVRLQFAELERNTGTEQIVSLVNAHMKACEAGHAKSIVKGLYALAEDRVEGSFESLDTLVSDVASVGGIDPTKQASWKSSRLYIASGDADIRNAFRKVTNSIYDNGGGRPNLIIAGSDVYDEYEASLDEAVRYTTMGVGETRFQELRFDGIVVRRDPDCQRDRAYFLNTDALHLRFLNSNFMKVQPAQTITGTLDFVTPIASILAVGTESRRSHGVLVRGEEPANRVA